MACPEPDTFVDRHRGLLAVATRGLVLALLLAARVACADTWALLVGVGEVASLPPRLWLRGPLNDVLLMRDVLRERGVPDDHVLLLADRGAGTRGRPTHDAITRAMADLAARVRPGDHVVFHLAGHGAQVPQRTGAAVPEPDGLDEVFLTADVQRWDTQAGRLPGALYDDEIGDWMDRLVDRGASVLAVFDACHAAGLARDRGGPWRQRAVPAAELGVPSADALPRVAPRVGRTPAAPAATAAAVQRRDDGRVLALAARGHESTGEEWLPKGGSVARTRLHGVFSHAVAQALRDGAGSPDALRQAVRQRYAQDGRMAPVPVVLGGGVRVLP